MQPVDIFRYDFVQRHIRFCWIVVLDGSRTTDVCSLASGWSNRTICLIELDEHRTFNLQEQHPRRRLRDTAGRFGTPARRWMHSNILYLYHRMFFTTSSVARWQPFTRFDSVNHMFCQAHGASRGCSDPQRILSSEMRGLGWELEPPPWVTTTEDTAGELAIQGGPGRPPIIQCSLHLNRHENPRDQTGNYGSLVSGPIADSDTY